jgi:hypothetical protein
MKFRITNASASVLRLNEPSRFPFAKTSNVCSWRTERDRVSHPYKATGKLLHCVFFITLFYTRCPRRKGQYSGRSQYRSLLIRKRYYVLFLIPTFMFKW